MNLYYDLKTWLPATDGLRSVRTASPHIARIVGPLENALRAGDVWRQSHAIPEDALLLRFFGNVETMFAAARQYERIPVEAVLGRLERWVVVGAQQHFEATEVVGR